MFLELAVALALSPDPSAMPPAVPGLVAVEYILPAVRVVPYTAETNLVMLSEAPLSQPAQEAFDTEFRPGTYFGAFAVSKDGGWGYSTGSNTMSAAREIATQQCETTNTSACRIISELFPVGFVPLGPGDITIAPEALGHYLDPETNIRPFAMAVSEDGAYSKVWGMASQEEADATALSDCESYRMQGLSDMPCILLPPAPKK
jgi:hypothetical protein